MNDYITLDTFKYTTLAKNWEESSVTPSTSRILLNSAHDSTFGPTTKITWTGEIKIRVDEAGAGWGTIANFKTTCKKKERIGFTDHYGGTYDAHLKGYKQRSLSPMWDGSSNVMYYTVIIEAKYA